MNIFGFLAISGMILYGLAAVALVILRRRRKRSSAALGRHPKISILKPLKGIDDGLRDNLESFFNIDYPDYEIIFGASEADDPAMFVARSLSRKYPDRTVVFSIGSSASGTNPKVRNLIEMIKHSRGELIVVSDSNTRVDRHYLTRSIDCFSDPKVALVSHFLAGRGEETSGAVFEHLHICGFIAAAQAFATVYGRITPIIGKSMIIRRSHLEEVGGVQGLADYLAEDYLLGRKLARAGKKVTISPWTVTNWNSRTTVKVFIFRHYRWLCMRWKINPFTCLIELYTIPLLWNLLWLLTGAASPLYPLAVWAAHTLIQQGVVTYVREGRPLPLKSVALSPVKDLLHLLILFLSMLGTKVEWRGNYYKMGWKTRLTPIEPPPHRVLDPCLFSARLGDPWPLWEKPYLGHRPTTLI
jgi:ceramide glucosyltransferase